MTRLLAAIFLVLAASPSAAECDLVLGREVYRKCEACHALDPGAGGTEGPSLHGVVGRAAGSLAEFRFSPALRRSAIVWDREQLDGYLRQPLQYIPGSRMPFAGLADDAERAQVICFLESLDSAGSAAEQ